MKFWVGVTDNSWFKFLSEKNFDEVNFWQPSATPPFTRAPVGMPFLFKLKKPQYAIAGGGFFVTYSQLPLNLAWEIFGEKNGAPTFEVLKALLAPLSSMADSTRNIGCTVVANPFFLPREEWLLNPPGWSSNIVRGKMYDALDPNGGAIWTQMNWVLPHLFDSQNVGKLEIREPGTGYGQPVWSEPRLGQSSFRVLVTDAYKRRCAMTGETTLATLEAAHIMPYSKLGTHEVRNGLLLRADFHRLFDIGLVSVGPDLRIRVSTRIKEAWFNGKAYYRLNNEPLAVLPDRPADRPDRDLLNWHLQHCFQA